MKNIWIILLCCLLFSCQNEETIPVDNINLEKSIEYKQDKNKINNTEIKEKFEEKITLYWLLTDYFVNNLSHQDYQSAYELKYKPELSFEEFKKNYTLSENEEFVIDKFDEINEEKTKAKVEIILFNRDNKNMTKYISIFEIIDNKLKTLDTKVVTHEVLDTFEFEGWKAIVEWNKWKKNLFIDTNGEKKFILSREIQYDQNYQRYDRISTRYTFNNFELINNYTTLLFEASIWEIWIFYTYDLYEEILLWPFYNYENALEWKYDNYTMVKNYYNNLSNWKFENAYRLKYQPNISFQEFKTKYSDYENYEYFIAWNEAISENSSDFEIIWLDELTWEMVKYLVRINFHTNTFDSKVVKIIHEEIKQNIQIEKGDLEVIWNKWIIDAFYISEDKKIKIFTFSPQIDNNSWKYLPKNYFMSIKEAKFSQEENKITFILFNFGNQEKYEYLLDENILKKL